eukprot:476818-Rhodomonas_salina.3
MNRKFQHTNLGSHKQWVILAAGCVSVLLFLWLFIGYTSTHANHGAACTDDLLFEWYFSLATPQSTAPIVDVDLLRQRASH